MTQELQFSSVYGQPKKYNPPARRVVKAHYQIEPDISEVRANATTDFSRLLNISQGDVYQARLSHHSMVRDSRLSRNQASIGAKSALSRLNLTEIQANNQSTAMSDYLDRQSQMASAKHTTHHASQHSSVKQASLLVSSKVSQRQQPQSRNNGTLKTTSRLKSQHILQPRRRK